MVSKPHTSCAAYRFGPFRLSIHGRILERDGERIKLTPKVIDALFVLVENAGQVVSKEDLLKAVWPDVTVVESGLTRNISVLRRAIEEGLEEGTVIETIPRRGYRFRAEVREEFDPEPAVPAPVPLEPPGGQRARRPPAWVWMALSGLVVVAAAGSWSLLDRGNGGPRASVEPEVRIGEHLLWKWAPQETIRAQEHFERALARNPNSAGAHAGLSVALLQLSALGTRMPGEALPLAENAARKAVALDPSSGTAQYAMAMIRAYKDWDFRAADAGFRRALELEPGFGQARAGYARIKLAIGELAEARQLLEEALRLDPASPPLGAEYCRVFYYSRDFHRAESECRKVLDREPGYGLAHYYLALSLGHLGRTVEAEQNLNQSGLAPGVLEADYAWLKLRNGDRRPALAVLEKRRDMQRRGTVDATSKLLLAAMLERTDEAYEAIEAGLATRASELLTIHIEPRLDAIRKDPRYEDVLQRIGIPR